LNNSEKPAFGSVLDLQTYIVKSVVDALEIGPDTAVVEFGAGTGDFTLPIAHRLQQLDGNGIVFGLDISDRLVEALDQRAFDENLDNRVRAVSLTRTKDWAFPIKDAKVDRVLSVNALQYLDDPSSVYSEIERVLKPGGSLFVADWRRDGFDFSDVQSQSVFANKVKSDMVRAGLHHPELVEQQPSYWILRARKVG